MSGSLSLCFIGFAIASRRKDSSNWNHWRSIINSKALGYSLFVPFEIHTVPNHTSKDSSTNFNLRICWSFISIRHHIKLVVLSHPMSVHLANFSEDLPWNTSTLDAACKGNLLHPCFTWKSKERRMERQILLFVAGRVLNVRDNDWSVCSRGKDYITGLRQNVSNEIRSSVSHKFKSMTCRPSLFSMDRDQFKNKPTS